ncbi:MAG: hypothetical protein OEW98_10875, partial [Betaproteobacteria bacterium]|nr:hypothetical protein [Betaproteobacteria bacterium]
VNALLAEKGYEAMTVDEVADVLKRSGNYRGAQVIELMHAAAFGGLAARVAPALRAATRAGLATAAWPAKGAGLPGPLELPGVPALSPQTSGRCGPSPRAATRAR